MDILSQRKTIFLSYNFKKDFELIRAKSKVREELIFENELLYLH